MITIHKAIDSFLANLQRSQPKNTYKNYKSDLLGSSGFVTILGKHIKPTTPASALSEDMAAQFLQILLDAGSSPATRQRKAAAIREFFRFVIAMDLASISIEKLNFKIKSGRLLAGSRSHIEFPQEKIEKTLAYVRTIKPAGLPSEMEIRRNQAFIFTLAETGLRVSEACALKVGQIDHKNKSAVIIGKGNKQAQIYFGSLSWTYLGAYLKIRAESVGISDWKTLSSHGNTLSMWPVFTRHDKNAGKHPKHLTSESGETIIHNWVFDALGPIEYDPKITCHKLRHYYVTKVLDESGDLKTAQDLARHASIATTANYAHRSNRRNQQAHTKIFSKD